MKTVSAAEANRHFSKLLREVKEGATVTVTSHGQPVAQIVPFDTAGHDRMRARKKLLAKLKAIPPSNVPRTWTRDELYEDDD